jgi:hypothetical protein
MEREISIEAVYRDQPDIQSGVLALLAYARQMQETAQTDQPEVVNEPEASDG